MKGFIFIFLLSILAANNFAQITVTESDLNAYFALGNSYVNQYDTAEASVNIGQAGQFTLSFAGHVFHQSGQSKAVLPSTTGYADLFSGANIVLQTTNVSPEGTTDAFAFHSIETGELLNHGFASKISSPAFMMEFISKPYPHSHGLKVPAAPGLTWTDDYIDSLKVFINGVQSSAEATHYTSVHLVDGWGTVVTPDNRTIEVIRIKEETMSYNALSGYYRDINYTFLAKSGESFSVSPIDTLQAGSGTIMGQGFSWSSRVTTGIREDVISANDYKLLSNYPNPFNPSTQISYFLPLDSKVNLAVFNSLGEQVALLADGTESKGMHEVNFKATGLTSGTYLYKLTAVSLDGKKNFSSSGKMLLLK